MKSPTKNPVLAGTSSPGLKNTTQQNDSKPSLKWKRVLQAFYYGRSLNRFESTRELRDWCLHSTVSVLQGKGVVILRRDELVPGYQGIPTHVCRYWLAPESRQRASELLGHAVAAALPNEPCAHPGKQVEMGGAGA